jgi:hypothetical protein
MSSKYLAASAAAALSLLFLGAAAADGASDGTPTPYALQRTVTCLKHRGAVVGRIIPTNRRLRALRDLAQKTSVQARLRGVVIGLAFARSTSSAGLLFELLTVPRDPLRLEQQRNVILLSPKTARTAHATVVGCLRV